MAPFKSLAVFLYFLLTGALALLDNVTQVDLLFPHNNTVYQPVYPFPFVFGVQNAHLAAPFQSQISWTLKSAEAPYDSILVGVVETPSDPLVIDSTHLLVNSTISRFHLIVDFDIRRSCVPPSEAGMWGAGPALSTKQIWFNISREAGERPSILAGGPCGYPIGAYEVNGSMPDRQFGQCALLADPAPELQACSFKIDESVARQVERAMVNISQCASWPDASGSLGRCIPQSTGSPITVSAVLRDLLASLAVLWGVLWMGLI